MSIQLCGFENITRLPFFHLLAREHVIEMKSGVFLGYSKCFCYLRIRDQGRFSSVLSEHNIKFEILDNVSELKRSREEELASGRLLFRECQGELSEDEASSRLLAQILSGRDLLMMRSPADFCKSLPRFNKELTFEGLFVGPKRALSLFALEELEEDMEAHSSQAQHEHDLLVLEQDFCRILGFKEEYWYKSNNTQNARESATLKVLRIAQEAYQSDLEHMSSIFEKGLRSFFDTNKVPNYQELDSSSVALLSKMKVAKRHEKDHSQTTQAAFLSFLQESGSKDLTIALLECLLKANRLELLSKPSTQKYQDLILAIDQLTNLSEKADYHKARILRMLRGGNFRIIRTLRDHFEEFQKRKVEQ